MISAALPETEKRAWLRLIRSENVGPVTFSHLLKQYRSAEEALRYVPELAKRGGRKKPIRLYSESEAKKEYDLLLKNGGTWVALDEPEYPRLLAQIPDAPPLIAALGHVSLLKKPCLAMVGTRHASLNGKSLTRQMAAELSQHDFCISSGMARGIDAAAHEGALAEKGGTVAVLGCGVDVVYPLENKALYEKIVEGGLVVSEFPLGMQPQPSHFPRRNRIISGLALATVVVEATTASGSLLTARMALEQGREVLAVPGFPSEPRSAGPNKLIRDGAALVASASDVMEALADILRTHDLEEPPPFFFEEAAVLALSESEIDKARGLVLSCLSVTPVTVDELIAECGVGADVMAAALVELELAGWIARAPGNRVYLIAEGMSSS